MRHKAINKTFTRNALVSAIVAVCFSATAMAQENDPADLPDESWISLTGTVTSAEDDSFRMDYGDGMITVEMDDWDSFGDAYMVMDGDQVTVYGAVDKGLFQDTKIEAGSVYIDDLNSFFYASAADEEEYGHWAIVTDAELGDMTYIGTVATVDPLTDTFTIKVGQMDLSVDTSAMLYDPLDDEGFQRIGVGDRVSVEAEIDSDFIGDQDLLAESIVTLSD